MMVEIALDSAQDFGTSGPVPQWKRELLQRRAARRAPPTPPLPPSAPPAPPDDEELRYGPGIVKRLQSRYLSLALRDTPNRPTVLRRAASLEHLLDEPREAVVHPPPQPPAAARRARPVSVAAPPVPRLDPIKRARSVDALSRLEAPPRAPRPPSRPRPLLRDTERPPVDLVRSALRKFEPTPARRPAPAARVSAVLRGLECGSRGPTPERTPPPRVPSPKPPSPAPPSPAPRAEANIAQNLETKAHVIAKSNSVDAKTLIVDAKNYNVEAKNYNVDAKTYNVDVKTNNVDTKSQNIDAKVNHVDAKPVSRAALEGIARAGSTVRYSFEAPRPGSHLPPTPNRQSASPRRVGVIRPMPAVPRALRSPPPPEEQPIAASTPSQIVTPSVTTGVSPRGAPGGSTSVVFNFVGRRTVPDYVEDDGRVRTVPKSSLFKEGEAGVVLLRADALRDEADEEDGCGDDDDVDELCVRFVNDNIIINGRSSMHSAAQRRAQQLKLQFDDSLTRTHEYPSEASLCEFDDDTPPPDTAQAALGHNTHISSVSLGEYTPHKTQHDAFRLGLVAPPPPPSVPPPAPPKENGTNGNGEDVADGDADNTRSWSDARTLVADLLF